jgi:type VI secretion system protein VasD
MKELAMLVGALALAACGGAPPPKAADEAPKACEPQAAQVTIAASDSVNGDGAGQGRPVQVRVYQLKTDARLKISSFQDIWQNDKATLQNDLVKVDEYTAFPRQSKQLSVAPSPEATVIAAVALFREPRGKSWFVTYELEATPKTEPCPKEPPKISVWLDRMQIEDGEGQGNQPAPDDGSGSSSPAASEPAGSAAGEGH